MESRRSRSRAPARLRQFTQSLQKGEKISKRFRCKKVRLDLQPTPYDPELVKETRAVLGVSQALFAQFIGVDTGTVQKWEQGEQSPSKMACRFMDEIRRHGDYWRERLEETIKVTA